MAYKSWSSPISTDSSLSYRAWGSEIRDNFLAIGLVQTTDTGQVDWSTAEKPSVNNTLVGYEIWRFNDSLQATAPIFFKIEYYRSHSTTTIKIQIKVGTGSDGSGNITGYSSSLVQTSVTVTPGSLSYTSYFCHTEGFLGIVFKAQAASGGPVAAFIITRTCNTTTGIPNGNGVIVITNGSNDSVMFNIQTINLLNGNVSTNTVADTCIVPQGITNSRLLSSDNTAKIFYHQVYLPNLQKIFSIGTVVKSEFLENTTFKTVLVGSTLRTFISVGGAFNKPSTNSGNNYSLAMLWE